MAEETKETKEWKFGKWVRENSRTIVATAIIAGGICYFVGTGRSAQQNKAYRQDIIGILEKVVLQDPNKAKILVDAMKPKEQPKEEAKDIKKEAEKMAKDKDMYIQVLEEHRGFRKENEALTVERNALVQKYDALSKDQAPLQQKYTKTLEDLKAASDQKAALEVKQKELIKQVADVNEVAVKLSKEQAPLQQKYAKTLEELTATLKLKEQLEARQKDLSKQVADMNETTVKLTGENNKMNKAYVTLAEAKKIADVNSVEVTAKLVDSNKKYMQLLEEKAKLEKEIIEKYVPALDAYNILFRQRGISRPGESGESRRPRVESEKATEETKYGLLALHVGAIKRSKEAAIVFLKGNLNEVDGKKSDFFERTDRSSVEEIVNRFDEERYALLTDANNDGILDIMYKRKSFNLKEGKRDGTFAPSKTVSGEFYYEVLKKCVNKGLGFD